jgi:hypothetical protein
LLGFSLILQKKREQQSIQKWGWDKGVEGIAERDRRTGGERAQHGKMGKLMMTNLVTDEWTQWTFNGWRG